MNFCFTRDGSNPRAAHAQNTSVGSNVEIRIATHIFFLVTALTSLETALTCRAEGSSALALALPLSQLQIIYNNTEVTSAVCLIQIHADIPDIQQILFVLF